MQSVCKCFFKFIIIKILLSCQVEVNKLLINYFFCKYETILSMFSLSISQIVFTHILKRISGSQTDICPEPVTPHTLLNVKFTSCRNLKTKNFICRKLLYLKRLPLIFGNGILLQKTAKMGIYTQTYVCIACYNMLYNNYS